MKLLSYYRYHYGFYRLDKPFTIGGVPKLTAAEKKQIRETWEGVDINFLDYTWSRIYKKIKGFSPYYLGALWNQEIDYKVNPTSQVVALENKALCDVYFPELNFPKPYVRCLNGSLFDEKMNYISMSEAIAILKMQERFVIKPSVDTMQGSGVKVVNVQETPDIESVMNSAGKNFIVQEALKQLKVIEELNPTSLNCFRVTSMYFNGRFGFATALKVGKKGATRDNWNSAYWIGVDKNGVLLDYGFDYKTQKIYQTDNGIKFSGFTIPNFDRLISFVETNHKKYFPHCGIIGWDITIDSKGVVRVIETNLKNPGTQIEQLCSGPFLEPFRDDICKIMKRK